MSAKANRLKSRLRIKRERDAARQKVFDRDIKVLADATTANARLSTTLREKERNLNRAAALRIRVEHDFMEPRGGAWAVNVTIYPMEYRVASMRSRSGPVDVRHFAYQKGREAGEQIARVIERCLAGEFDEFRKAQ